MILVKTTLPDMARAIMAHILLSKQPGMTPYGAKFAAAAVTAVTSRASSLPRRSPLLL